MRKWVLISTSALTVLAATIISPALPKIDSTFRDANDTKVLISFVLTITSLFVALSAPVIGFFIDKIGRRPILLTALILYALFGSAGLYLTSLSEIVTSRIFLGIAIAGVITSITTLVADYFKGKEREEYLGLQASAMAIGGFLFLALGGALAELSWRAPFFMYLLSLPAALLVYYTIPEPTQVERCTVKESIPLKEYTLILTAALLGMILYFSLPTRLPFYLAKGYNYTPLETGLLMGIGTLFAALSASQYVRIHHYLSKPLIYAMIFLLIGTGFLLLSQQESLPLLAIAIATTGFGFGSLIPNSSVWVTEIAPETVRGRMVGGLSSCLFIGQFLSSALSEPIVLSRGLTGPFGLYGIAGLFSVTISATLLILLTIKKRLLPHD